MALTGKKRSLTVTITKTLAGVMVAGYPKIYYGAQAFTWNSVNYEAIDTTRLATMPTADFTARLSAFQSWVQSQETGLNIATVQTNQPYYTP